MISITTARAGWNVYYLPFPGASPDYGRITGVGTRFVFVSFLGDPSKACKPEDLYWPPWYCGISGGNPPGQPFDDRPPEFQNARRDGRCAQGDAGG